MMSMLDSSTRSPSLCFDAGIVGSFPPTQLQIERTITAQQVRELNRFIAYHAEREVICTVAAQSTELILDVGMHLGSAGDFYTVGGFSEWPI